MEVHLVPPLFLSLKGDEELKNASLGFGRVGTWPTPEYFGIVFFPGQKPWTPNDIGFRFIDWEILRLQTDRLYHSSDVPIRTFSIRKHISSDHNSILAEFEICKRR
ncbi:hypothetical protein [Leptospira weilii]|uniref:hypothetical protein n=1 Tax=Leptospira weilii TaxID=28184 RepID=UPI0019134E46|nr:hypothetical protein [Leptospira weilii]